MARRSLWGKKPPSRNNFIHKEYQCLNSFWGVLCVFLALPYLVASTPELSLAFLICLNTSRWKKENQSYPKWVKSCVEWGECNTLTLRHLLLKMRCPNIDYVTVYDTGFFSCLPVQILEFDLKGSPLDSSSFIDVVVKDYETIGKDKYALCIFPLFYRFL